MGSSKYLIIIAGPTAVGKTSISIELAKYFDSEIISSDSRQYYREMSIGTTKPTVKEQAGVLHHFINHLSIHDKYSIGQFERDVISKLSDRFDEKDNMIMTGGSGMHIRAITHGLDEFPDIPSEVRNRISSELREKGIGALQEELISRDSEYAKVVDMNNPHRLIRALAVIEVSGRTYTSYLNQSSKSREFHPIFILLERDREDLYARINKRVDQMMDLGQELEAKSLMPFRHLQALNTIGYKELFQYFDGNIDLQSAVELIKRNSRRYAKRQLTWFRKEPFWNMFHPDDKDSILEFIQKKMDKENKRPSQ